METKQVRLRFAPSPTGYLHIGGTRTALYNWLYARKHNGTFILRIEDTDQERSTKDSIQEILDGLKWLGLDWDEGYYLQSDYRAQHLEAANELLQAGNAYKCFCTQEELQQKRSAAEKQKTTYRYDRTCCRLGPEEIAAREKTGLPFVIRFKVPEGPGTVTFEEAVYGKREKACKDIEDFVIVRSDGLPLYLLSNAVDDMRDRITHIIRGQEGLESNTPRQVLIYQALGKEPPVFAHMNLSLDPKRAKISKRKHGEVVTVAFYRKKGFLPWALCNFLLLLGWSTDDNKEIINREEAIQEFTLEKISRANSVFNYRKDDPKFFTDPKALSINSHYIQTMDIEELSRLVTDVLKEADLWRPEYEQEKREWYIRTVDLIRERYHTLQDFAELGRPYFHDEFDIMEKALKKNLLKESRLKQWLPELADRIEGLNPFDMETAESVVRAFAEEKEVKPGVIINAIRASVTGQLAGPGLFDILVTVGPASTALRLRKAAQII